MNWISTEERMPEKSGYYLVCIFRHRGRQMYSVLEYSKKHNAFCASDCLPDAPFAMHVDYWAEIEPVNMKGQRK